MTAQMLPQGYLNPVHVMCGTEVNISQEGIPAVIPVEFCYMGWQESLTPLNQLVEADIPDQL